MVINSSARVCRLVVQASQIVAVARESPMSLIVADPAVQSILLRKYHKSSVIIKTPSIKIFKEENLGQGT